MDGKKNNLAKKTLNKARLALSETCQAARNKKLRKTYFWLNGNLVNPSVPFREIKNE